MRTEVRMRYYVASRKHYKKLLLQQTKFRQFSTQLRRQSGQSFVWVLKVLWSVFAFKIAPALESSSWLPIRMDKCRIQYDSTA